MTSELTWGLIGASTIAREHVIAAIRAQPGQDVAAVMSADPARAAAYAAEQGIARSYADLPSLLADAAVNAVYISTTNELHKAQVLAAAAAGKHVLCEKPLALTVTDAIAMRDACKRAGVVMATNHHLRNAATHRKMRELIAQGAIGRPLSARVFHAVFLPPHLQGWRINRPEAGGGVVLDITVHDVDTLRFVLNAEPVRVTALTQHTALTSHGLEDSAMAVFEFDNGALAQTHEAFTVKYAGTGFEVHGETGSLIARDVMTQRPMGQVWLRDAAGERAVDIVHENLYERGVRAFTAAVRGDGPPAATADDGIRSLNAALAVLESSRTGKVVEIAPIAP